MYLQGAIQRFNLASILQFLAQAECVGVLEVRDFEEYGFIYLVNGRVQAISLPVTDEKLGSRLIKAGLLTEEQLAQALIEDTQMTKEQKKAKPLGQRLIERGFTNEAQIREIMAKQTMDQVFELAHWQNGVFIYDEPERMPQFQITIQGNVQQLLLEAYRRIDEGEESKKGKSALEDEVCFACPVEDDCTRQIKAKYRKNDVCLWRDMGAVIDDRYDKLRDARQLYKSKEMVDGATLDAEL
jgi:Domain of unknown function (DUF4388)